MQPQFSNNFIDSSSTSVRNEGTHSLAYPSLDECHASTNRAWSKDEDDLLVVLVQSIAENDWAEVARHFTMRSEEECLKRWQILSPPTSGESKGRSSGREPWNNDEDKLLYQLVMQFGPSRWTEVASILNEKLRSRRLAKQCRERWISHVDPSVRRGEWSEDEDLTIMTKQLEWGNRWADIARQMKGRTTHAVKNRFHQLMRLKSQDIQVASISTSDNVSKFPPRFTPPSPISGDFQSCFFNGYPASIPWCVPLPPCFPPDPLYLHNGDEDCYGHFCHTSKRRSEELSSCPHVDFHPSNGNDYVSIAPNLPFLQSAPKFPNSIGMNDIHKPNLNIIEHGRSAKKHRKMSEDTTVSHPILPFHDDSKMNSNVGVVLGGDAAQMLASRSVDVSWASCGFGKTDSNHPNPKIRQEGQETKTVV
eukprot:Platyproteum_vivax@DN5954_c0_g1_i2.p1